MATNEHMVSATCGGNIRRGRVVWMNTDYTVLEMSVAVSFPPFGIAQPSSRNAPGAPFDTSLFAGSSGDSICIWTDGAVGALAESGGTVTAGKAVVADSTARIVDVGGAPPYSFVVVGQALESGAAGDVIRIKVGG